ncbi:hypothetical protein BCR33DRAFT_720501 [Rhizoclosmatium globosum]|uniref:Extracellular membrane protein CFEM domain-containing protein n=1 Tax=Rhizoclosmatium globosum TaxID=329046 RepID=A0A1Y2BVM7_9FUNG|nr:hypothetical protein BCR33DRAFT_720501 [Rhizoclosmatium globosum]|eukprot:ORY38832.1 hypothetical protein BCR33DRAFT_720501 [Rhizoclosmatium globosum]
MLFSTVSLLLVASAFAADAPAATVANPAAITNAPSAPEASPFNVLGFIQSMTPCATSCLSQVPQLVNSINFSSSNGLSAEAAQLCYQNQNLISTCASTCGSSVLSSLAASCATVGLLNNNGAGPSPLATVRAAASSPSVQPLPNLLFIGSILIILFAF